MPTVVINIRHPKILAGRSSLAANQTRLNLPKHFMDLLVMAGRFPVKTLQGTAPEKTIVHLRSRAHWPLNTVGSH